MPNNNQLPNNQLLNNQAHDFVFTTKDTKLTKGKRFWFVNDLNSKRKAHNHDNLREVGQLA